MKAVNPATGETIREYEEHGEAEVRRRLDLAGKEFVAWRTSRTDERARLMRRLAETLRGRSGELGVLMTREMGKPILESEAEVEKCAWVADFYAGNAERFLAPEVIETDATRSFVRYDPLGPVLAVMPWNFPLWQVFRFAVPGIAAGNVALLKHASNVPGCALAIEEVFAEAGFPAGVFQTLLVSSRVVEELLGDPAIVAATLTGSERAGVAVAGAAGRNLKKTVLELGGSDPFIVLADADLPAAVTTAVRARMINSGQSCIAAKRFIVEAPLYEEFAARFTKRAGELRTGDPMSRETDVGPLARADLREELHDQVRRSVEAGATLLLGGRPGEGPGYFYPPTVLGEVEPGMAAFDEETFGPVAALVRARDAEDAIRLANLSELGLGAAIFTTPERGEALAPSIEAGCVFVNGLVKSDPRLPFGGIKRSGYGRELAAIGIREFVNVKTVWIKA